MCYAPCARANDTRCASAAYGARTEPDDAAGGSGGRAFVFDRVFGEYASAHHSALDLGFYGMGDAHAVCALDALEAGGFVDAATSDVTLRVLAYNAASGASGLWALLRVRFRFGAYDESGARRAAAAVSVRAGPRARRSRAAPASSRRSGASRCLRCGLCTARRPTRAGSSSSCCCSR